MAEWVEYAGAIHLHTRYSDGRGDLQAVERAARRAGLRFVVITDHNTLAAGQEGREGWRDGLLVLVGVEVTPEGENHYLALGLAEPVSHQLPPAEIIAQVAARGGLGFVAHPVDRGSGRFRKGNPWRDWSLTGFTGIELWNYSVDWSEGISGLLQLVPALLWPALRVEGPDPAVLRWWDRLNQQALEQGGRLVAAIGGLDAHGILYGYERMMRAHRTRVLIPGRFTGDLDTDRRLLCQALAAGRCFIAYDGLQPAEGFRFWAGSENGTTMGSRLSLPAGGLVLGVDSPAPARLRLVANGQTIDEVTGRSLRRRVSDPGVYRVEAYLPVGRRGEKPWVFTNPILVEP